MAFAEETGFSEDEAYAMLYGSDEPKPNRCPICNHKCRSKAGVLGHMEAKHTKPKHADRIAAYRSQVHP